MHCLCPAVEMKKEGPISVFIACYHVFSHLYPPLHHNGKGLFQCLSSTIRLHGKGGSIDRG